MADKANLKIDPETRRRLKVWCAERDLTYDEGIHELIDRDEADDEV